MAAMLKTALAAICILVVLAVGYLTLSLVVLRPPRVNYPAWMAMASIVLVLSGITLTALAGFVRPAAAAGVSGATLALLGAWLIQQTLASTHFEGYQLVLGVMLVVQGGLALVVFGFRQLFA